MRIASEYNNLWPASTTATPQVSSGKTVAVARGSHIGGLTRSLQGVFLVSPVRRGLPPLMVLLLIALWGFPAQAQDNSKSGSDQGPIGRGRGFLGIPTTGCQRR